MMTHDDTTEQIKWLEQLIKQQPMTRQQQDQAHETREQLRYEQIGQRLKQVWTAPDNVVSLINRMCD